MSARVLYQDTAQYALDPRPRLDRFDAGIVACLAVRVRKLPWTVFPVYESSAIEIYIRKGLFTLYSNKIVIYKL